MPNIHETYYKVSIHTPTQGVTYTHCLSGDLINLFQSTHPRRVWLCRPGLSIRIGRVSIHTPTQGVTIAALPIVTPGKMFQSTHPRRVWPIQDGGYSVWCNVSIHTPTQGVTGRIMFIIKTGIVSIHTPTQGVTWLICMLKALFLFQSTHPRRVWLVLIQVRLLLLSFNPHTHAGCDISKYMLSRIWIVSIHTPTQGVTNGSGAARSLRLFQSTHPRRVWQWHRL